MEKEIKNNKEAGEIQIGQTISYHDMANPYHEGIIVKIKDTSNKFLLFGGNGSMEKINQEAIVIFPDNWHKTQVPTNNIRTNEYAGFRLEDKPPLSQEEVDRIVSEYERMQPILEEQRKKSFEEKQKQEEEQRKKHRQEHPYLIKQEDSNLSGYALGAKNLKIELKKAFPDIKFSVKSESYAGGCSIHVNWVDGPSREAVEKYANKYQEGSFDGMNDLYTYSDQVWSDVFGGAKYVFCDREITEETAMNIAEGISEYNGHRFNGDLCADVDPDEPFREIGRWWDVVWKFTSDKDLTNFTGVEPIDCDCGQWPNDFFRIKGD